jgi:hypothetical protein
MQLTQEQKDIVQSVQDNYLTKVVARAGCGKTSTALNIVDELQPNNGLYFAFNKAIVLEGQEKFPTHIECKTIHALALKHTKLNIGNFSYHSIKENITYPEKQRILDSMDKFFNSSCLNPDEYFIKDLGVQLGTIASKYIHLMVDNKIDATFGMVIKYFHLLLDSEDIILTYELVILDEAGDTTEVILEIFKLIDAKRKVMLGDPFQNIYTFTHTVDGFSYLENEGVTLPLTNSFRVSPSIAEYVQMFSQKYIDKDFTFIGKNMDISDNTECHITRTNSTLIQIMLKLQEEGVTSFNSIRPISEIFELPLTVITVASGARLSGKSYSKYKYLVDEYMSYKNSRKFQGSYFTWLNTHLSNDIQITSTIRLILSSQQKGVNLFNLQEQFKKMQNKKSSISLGTAFVTKGLEYGTVHIGDDLHRSTLKVVETGVLSKEDYTELLLYYVACSRAKHTLNNYVEV